ncbi:MAG: epoxyqueuosine reductase QueH [Elusimicrobiota bacterium]
MKTLLFHTCCGPCGFSTTKFLSNEFCVKHYWYNPNIQPQDEYEKRLSVAKKLFPLIVDEYDDDLWSSEIKSVCRQPNKRCSICYRLRLTKVAQKSKELKMDFFSTTLLTSPYQKHDILKKIGEEVAKETGTNFYYYDGRRDFYKNLNKFRKLNLYIQNYCGCIFSKSEK